MSMDIPSIKKELKGRMALGLNYGIQAIEEIVMQESLLSNEVINYKSQYNDLNRIASQNILDYAQIEMGFNKIRVGLLDLIDRIGADDLMEEQELPNVQNRDLQYRKNNFFQLIDIHFTNLNSVSLNIRYTSGSQVTNELLKGRDAIGYIFKQYFIFPINDRKINIKGEEGEIYAQDFFGKYTKLEVYMKTVGFIIEYIQEDQVEQDFFKGVFKSILSTSELILIFYFAISETLPGFKQTIRDSGLIEESLSKHLLDSDHLPLLFEKE